MPASPQRKPREDREPFPDLGVCSVCGRTWREADDCKTPKDCNFQREDR